MKQRDRHLLETIVSEIGILEEALNGISLEGFSQDEVLKRAVGMATINVGELAKHLSKEFFEEHPISELKSAIHTRAVYAHGYFVLEFADVYHTSTVDFPRVRQWIENILSKEASDENVTDGM